MVGILLLFKSTQQQNAFISNIQCCIKVTMKKGLVYRLDKYKTTKQLMVYPPK